MITLTPYLDTRNKKASEFPLMIRLTANRTSSYIPTNIKIRAPQFPNGSIVLLCRTNEKAFIDWGKVYVLDTCNGIIMKRVLPGNTKDSVKCENIDKAYPPFDVQLSDINSWWAVLMVMINK